MSSLTLRDLVPEDEIRRHVQAMVDAMLDVPVTLSLGTGGVIQAKMETASFHTCPECGESFATLAGMSGHRFHKHGVRVSEKPKKAAARK